MTTAQTQGQTLPYRTMMMTTKSPLSPVNHLHHCSGQGSSRPCSPPWEEQSALSLMFPSDLELDALFEDHGVCFAVVEDMLTLERAVCQQCTPGQLPLSGRQRTNRQKCSRLADLVAAAVLPPHTADFPLQLLDFAHTWSARGDNDIDLFDILPLAAAVYIFIKTDPGRAHQPRYPRALPELLAAIAELLARRQPHNSPTLHTAWTILQVTRAAFHILERVRACNSYACGLDRNLRTSSISLGRTTALTAAAPEPPGGATNSTG